MLSQKMVQFYATVTISRLKEEISTNKKFSTIKGQLEDLINDTIKIGELLILKEATISFLESNKSQLIEGDKRLKDVNEQNDKINEMVDVIQNKVKEYK